MAKNKKPAIPPGASDEEIDALLKEENEDIAAPVSVVYYEHVMWKGVREVCKCSKCGTFRDDEDAMIEHVLNHYPVVEHEAIFDYLINQKQARSK